LVSEKERETSNSSVSSVTKNAHSVPRDIPKYYGGPKDAGRTREQRGS